MFMCLFNVENIVSTFSFLLPIELRGIFISSVVRVKLIST